jgi:ArsR family transcriptional regulator
MYEVSMQATAMQFKALCEPVRLRILNLLMSGELCVCDLMEILDLPQSTVSRHLAYLRNAGWVRGKRVGVWMHYLIADELDAMQKRVLEALSIRFADLPEVRADLEALKRHLETKPEDRCEEV